jgi:hypothetical protein
MRIDLALSRVANLPRNIKDMVLDAAEAVETRAGLLRSVIK